MLTVSIADGINVAAQPTSGLVPQHSDIETGLSSSFINWVQDRFYDLNREVSAERAQWDEEMMPLSR